MQTYLVGGAVRDKLLGISVKDRDWVVVGATPDQLLQQGFRQVGADFPVFLHPSTQEEYALARTERKQGHGYHGFSCYAAPDVSLEEDLIRRDLTINAMAEDNNGNLIDPFNGRSDLENRLLRHVSDAFTEDPLRVLRVARFAARLHAFGFTVAPETLALMTCISESGELTHLAAERIWQETARALMEPHPSVYFQVLKDCKALAALFPEIDALFGIPQPETHHPEIDTGLHTLLALQYSADQQDALTVRYAVLVHDLGKALTPPEILPHHYGHEEAGIPAVESLSKRLKVPNDCKQLALLATKHHTHVHQIAQLKPKTVLKLLQACDVLRRPERIENLVRVCLADARGRTGLETQPYPQADYLLAYSNAVREVDPQVLISEGISGKALGDALHKKRLGVIAQVKDKLTAHEQRNTAS